MNKQTRKQQVKYKGGKRWNTEESKKGPNNRKNIKYFKVCTLWWEYTAMENIRFKSKTYERT